LNSEKIKRWLSSGQSFDWESVVWEIFRFQARENPIYRRYLDLLGRNPENIKALEDIPFLPVEAFKYHPVRTGEWKEVLSFLSSGTTQTHRAVHLIRDIDWYDQNAASCLSCFLPDFNQYEILGLLPGYLENPSSSLIHMVKHLAQLAANVKGEKFLFSEMDEFYARLIQSWEQGRKILAFGVSFAWLDFADRYRHPELDIRIIETGGMKTSIRSVSKAEIIDQLRESFPKARIGSEYGMTEMLSQAYSDEQMRYRSGPIMRVFVRSAEDPFGPFVVNQRGRIHVLDLANADTCCFLETGDLGEVYEDGSFTVIGRLATETIRGCSLMYEP